MISGTINRKIKRYYNRIIDNEFHDAHRKQVTSILNAVEIQKGKLSKVLYNQCDEYAITVLGNIKYAPWLYVYSAISEEFKVGWIPDNYYASVVLPVISGGYAEPSDLKSLSKTLLNSNHIPDILYFVNGHYIAVDSKEILSKERASIELFSKNENVIFKPDQSQQGIGIKFLNKQNFINSAPKINGVFQSIIKQHDFFNSICNNSVATLRVTTLIDNEGKCSVRAVYLRVGRNNDSHVKSSTHIRIPVDIVTGRLSNKGFLTNWNTITEHPDTHFKFNGTIPEFQKCCELAVNNHLKYPFVRCIGWDMIIDINNHVNIMEWNAGHNDIKFSEATQGPCFIDMKWESLK
ncbi:TPA: hypothetical protein SLN32_002326 [Proteus mirabilis]|nr:hypothetical protein [Proteus mirabilis]